MEGSLFWIAALVVLIVVAVGMFSLGTRASVSTGGYCEVDTHWYFGWWVRCKGGERCSSGKCTLQWRRKDSEDHWADAGVVPEGSVKWSSLMEYRCVCAD